MALAIRPFLPYSYNHFVTELVSLHKSRFSQFLGDPLKPVLFTIFFITLHRSASGSGQLVASWAEMKLCPDDTEPGPDQSGDNRAAHCQLSPSCPGSTLALPTLHSGNTFQQTCKKTFLNFPQAYFKHLPLSLFIKFLVHLF